MRAGTRRQQHDDDRAATPLVGIILLVAVTVVVGTLLVVLSFTLLPQEEPQPRPESDFAFDQRSEALHVWPTYMTEGTEFELLVNGSPVYSWTGGASSEERRLRCLFPGDRVSIRAWAGSGQSYLIEDRTLEAPTGCPIANLGEAIGAVIVENSTVNVLDPTYEFVLQIDPQGPGVGHGPVPVTNRWHYVKRYDRSLEGLDAPVYVVVFADNANYGASPSGPVGVDSYTINGDQIVPTPGGSEPTNDIYLAFSPGCDGSDLQFIAEQAGYDNAILLGETTVIANTNQATPGTVYSAPAVTCGG